MFERTLRLILAVASAVMVVAGLDLLFAPVALKWLGLVLFLMSAFIWWLMASTKYGLDSQFLVIKSGPFQWRIELDAIDEVHPTHNPLSAPALSLDRLRINYHIGDKMRFALISPRNKSRFLKDLAEHVAGLEMAGDRVLRHNGACP